MIVDGETGFLTADNDLSLGLRIMQIARDAELRAKMGRAAGRYSQRYSAHNNAREVLGTVSVASRKLEPPSEIVRRPKSSKVHHAETNRTSIVGARLCANYRHCALQTSVVS